MNTPVQLDQTYSESIQQSEKIRAEKHQLVLEKKQQLQNLRADKKRQLAKQSRKEKISNFFYYLLMLGLLSGAVYFRYWYLTF
jgi:hypothetical protein|tara:strand:- start:1807 stop:2055 length:249 start_codon:yes stop_codon:yes gene_type:complete